MLRIFMLLQRAFWGTLWRRLLGRSPRAALPLQVDAAVRFLQLDWADMKSWPIARLREDLEGRPVPRTATSRVRVESVRAGGVAAVWVKPLEKHDDRVVLYLHGGSYLFGSHRTHADTLARVALASKALVLAPDYRRAPEDPYPAQLDDAIAAYQWLLTIRPPAQIVVAGESAGGNLVVALLIALRERGLPLPAGGVPISAWLDLESTRPSIEGNAATDYGDVEMLRDQARQFAGTLPLKDPRISPLFADLSGLPPLYIQAGDAERLRDENVELAAKVRAAGGEAEIDLVPHHPHAPLFFAEWSPLAQEGVDRIGAWIQSKT